MVAADADSRARPSSVRAVIGSPLYRGATVSLFIAGIGMSASAPQIARYLVEDLGASLPVAGMYYLTNLTAPIAGYLVGARSDRTGNRLGLFRLCSLAGALGWVLIAASTHAWMPFIISALVLGVAGASGSQLFAAVHDHLARGEQGVADGVVSIVRMALTAGWVIGPMLGAYLVAASGFTAMLLVSAACFLVQLLPLGRLRDVDPPRATTHVEPGDLPSTGRPGVAAMLPLLAFTGLYVLVYAGEPIKYAYLPIHMDIGLGLSAGTSGAVIGTQPLVELLLMPLAFLVSRRTGLMPLMVGGALCGVAANLCFALTGTALGMFAGQVLMGAVWGIFAALGIIVAQRLLPQAVATASAVFMSSPAIASALGGLSGGIGVDLLGLPRVFLVPGVCAALAALGLLVMSRSRWGVR